ncbi:alpha/beta-hydrolase, partial [Peniophora sp. CONT]
PFPDVLQLPSGLRLRVNLTYPRLKEVDGAKKLAVCSHPWSRLGGSMSDPVLVSLVEPLSQLGYHVLLFNARGVGGSSGWASWTAFQEGKDLEELVSYMIEVLGDIRDVVLIGYSNGCLSTSLHPVHSQLVRTSHIFISYPLDVRSWLTMFNGRTYQQRLEELVRRPDSRVLFVFGDRDEFTGVSSYEKWLAALQDLPSVDAAAPNGSRLKVVRVDGASHFWGGRA